HVSSSPRSFTIRIVVAVCGLVAAVWSMAPAVGAQKRPRSSRFIEALEAGKPAITGDTWAFLDREHRPYVIEEIQAALNKMFADKNDKGQVAITPIVRIPMEGDQEAGWAIKQVLERGAMGIVIPHVETA